MKRHSRQGAFDRRSVVQEDVAEVKMMVHFNAESFCVCLTCLYVRA